MTEQADSGSEKQVNSLPASEQCLGGAVLPPGWPFLAPPLWEPWADRRVFKFTVENIALPKKF